MNTKSIRFPLPPTLLNREEELHPLLGLPLRRVDRLGARLLVHFGHLQEIVMEGGKSTFVGEWILEVNEGCPWRILRSGQIVLGAADVRSSPLGDSRDPQGSETTRFDLAAHFFRQELATNPPLVQSVELDGVQGFKMELSGELTFVVFPADTDVESGPRYWHLIPPTDK